jgi:glycosyltransferase involved in cell wall biosynthesis
LTPFGIPAEAFVVGTMAAMRRVKRIDVLLRAAIQCADLQDVYWVLFGRAIDPEIRRLAANRKIRDRVRLVGHRSDASVLISGADVFVMPSRSEALCQALLEAMHQRVCPVVSDAGGMKEVVRHEQDGLVVPVENVDALAQTIRRLHADRQLVTQFAASAEQRIATTFTPERMAERCLSVYRHILQLDQPSHQAA